MSWYNRDSERGVANWHFGSGAVVGAFLYNWAHGWLPVFLLFVFMLALGSWRVWVGARTAAYEDYQRRHPTP